MASISILSDGVEQKYALQAAVVTIGRGLESDIRIKDIKASRRHFQIVNSPQGFSCVDLGSGNGTFINGVQIKTQKLAPGDKIQVGATTITFMQGAPAKTAPVAAPAQAPAAAAPAARPAARKGNTSQIAAQPTRRITSQVQAAKPTTGPAARTRPATGPVPRPGAAGRKGSTQRVGGAPRPAASVSERYQSTGKKGNSLYIVIGVIGAVFLGVVGLILFGGGDDPVVIRAHVKEITDRAARLIDQDQFDRGIQEYNKALELISGKKEFARDRMEIQAIVKQAQEDRGLLAAADQRYKEFKDEFDKNALAPRPLYDKGKELERTYANSKLPWLPELRIMLEKLDNLITTEEKTRKSLDFQVYRNDVIKNNKIEERKSGHAIWSGALRDWNNYLARNPGDDNRRKAENEITILQRWAEEDFMELKRRADRKVEEGQKADAIEELKQSRARFEKTEQEPKLEALIHAVDK